MNDDAKSNCVNNVNTCSLKNGTVKCITDTNVFVLNCVFANAHGLLSIMDILRDYTVNKKLDIIGVAETFVNNEVMQGEIFVEGYKIYREDRSSDKEVKEEV